MKIEVRCFSRGGSTLSIANAIADKVGVFVDATENPPSEPVDLMFLGSGIYAGKMGKPIYSFIENLTVSDVKKVALFSTAMSVESALKTCEAISAFLKEKGIAVDGESFQCPGKFLLANRTRPDAGDKAHAASFAEKIIKKST